MNACEQCKFWVLTDLGLKLGQCRRHAPVVNGAKTLFPYAVHSSFCGDFRSANVPTRSEPGVMMMFDGAENKWVVKIHGDTVYQTNDMRDACLFVAQLKVGSEVVG